MSRYRVINESQTAHCCFGFTVIDTSKPYPCTDPTTQLYDEVCECFNEGDAQLICDALNAYERKPT